MERFPLWSTSVRTLMLLLLFSKLCLCRNFKYVSHLSLDEYRHYKDGLSGGSVGTLFMHYPAQIFSCRFFINYRRFTETRNDFYSKDPFELSRGRISTNDDYFGFVSEELFETWSSCYQNFITRYCMFMITTTDRLFINRIRMCKHLYYFKSKIHLENIRHLVREVKPYINFHMRDHIFSGDHLSTFNSHGLFPLGIEYLYNWSLVGYNYEPGTTYSELKKLGRVLGDKRHGSLTWDYARFTMLEDSWGFKIIQIFHEVYWTHAFNNHENFTHELTNAYKDLEHIQLQYLAYICDKSFRNRAQGSTPKPDIVDISMCPNACRQSDPCSGRPHTSGSGCIPIGLGKEDFTCECLAGYNWNQDSLSCDESFDCNHDCSAANTRYCSFVPALEQSATDGQLNSREGHLRCECYPEFEGERCERPRDACTTGADGKLSGNEMCRADFGGQCIPTQGTSHYTCICPKGFRSKKYIREDNCMSKQTACDSVICANNGACYSSLNGSTFECKCTPGFEGLLCERQVAYHWTYWSDWTACDSLCGQGWQTSDRICWDRHLGREDSLDRCPGNKEALRVCHKHCLAEIQASHFMAIGLLIELLFRMLICIVGCFLFAKILFDLLFRELDYVFVRYLRIVLLDLVRRAVGARYG